MILVCVMDLQRTVMSALLCHTLALTVLTVSITVLPVNITYSTCCKCHLQYFMSISLTVLHVSITVLHVSITYRAAHAQQFRDYARNVHWPIGGRQEKHFRPMGFQLRLLFSRMEGFEKIIVLSPSEARQEDLMRSVAKKSLDITWFLSPYINSKNKKALIKKGIFH